MLCGYKCQTCGSDVGLVIEVKDRRPDEEIVPFVKRCVAACAEHHKKHKPWCWATALDLKMHAPKGTERIGAPPPAPP